MDVLAALAACTTPAAHYAVQLRAESILTPLEAQALARQRDSLPEDARPWANRLIAMCRRVQPRMAPYRRHDLADTASFYEGQGGGRRRLVICFTGQAQRMALPIAPFLQALPSTRCDVVVLRDATYAGFLGGVPGYAADLPALALRLRRDLPASWHEDRRCIGVSAGAAAAFAFGVLVEARAVLGLGGAAPADMILRRAPPGIDRHALDTLLTAGTATRLVTAYGEACELDLRRAGPLCAAVPGCRPLAVAEIAQHGVLPGLFARGLLARFLEEVLFAEALPAGARWPWGGSGADPARR